MRKVIVIVAMLVAVIQAQQVPVEVQRYMENYKKDSTAVWGFKDAQKLLELDTSIKASEIAAGIPFQEFFLTNDSLEKMPDTAPVEAFITPGSWKIPISVNGKYIYTVEMNSYGHPWKPVGMGEGYKETLQEVRARWPESTGIKPLIIRLLNRHFLYFPEKDPYKLFYLRPGYKVDSLAMITSNSFDTFDDSHKIIKFLKKELKKAKYEEDKWEKLFKLKTGEAEGTR